MIRRLALFLLMPAAALAVHQLRYMLAFGAHASAQLQAQGHSYLHSLVPWIVLLVAIACGGVLRSLGQALSGQRSLTRYTVSLTGLWLLCAVCLVAVYCTQEWLEGLFAAGHPTGLAGIFGYGGWWSIPAALAVGLVLAALLHGARWVLDEVAAARFPRIATTCPLEPAPRIPSGAVLLRPAPLARGWSGRGPPG